MTSLSSLCIHDVIVVKIKVHEKGGKAKNVGMNVNGVPCHASPITWKHSWENRNTWHIYDVHLSLHLCCTGSAFFNQHCAALRTHALAAYELR